MILTELTKDQQKEVHEALERFGLNGREQDVYFALLKLGKTTATPLAQLVHLPVSTTQSILQRLAKTGLIAITANKSRKAYEAHDPIALKRLLERQIQELQGTIPLLQTLRSSQKTPAKIRIYPRDRITDIFHRALQSKKKCVYEIISQHELQEFLGERFHFSKRRMEHGIRLKSLRVEAHEIKTYSKASHVRELREAKFLPRECTFRSSMLFWDDTVAILTTKQEGTALVIESPLLREMAEQIFEVLWSVGRKMETT